MPHFRNLDKLILLLSSLSPHPKQTVRDKNNVNQVNYKVSTSPKNKSLHNFQHSQSISPISLINKTHHYIHTQNINQTSTNITPAHIQCTPEGGYKKGFIMIHTYN